MRAGLSAFFAVLAFVCSMIGMVRVKLGQPDAAPFVIGFVVFVAAAIFFAWRDRKKRYREWLDLRRNLGKG